jgi:hypothetical protein
VLGSVERDQLFERRRELHRGTVNTKRSSGEKRQKKGVLGGISRARILFPQIGWFVGMIRTVQISVRHSKRLEHTQNNIPG